MVTDVIMYSKNVLLKKKSPYNVTVAICCFSPYPLNVTVTFLTKIPSFLRSDKD